MPVVGELVASGVPQHVRVDWEREFCSFSSPSDHFQESGSRCGPAALGDKNVSRFYILAA